MKKNEIMRRLFAIALVLTMCVSLLPASAFAEEQGNEEVLVEETGPEAMPEPTEEPAPEPTPEVTPEPTQEPEPEPTPEVTPEPTATPEPTPVPTAAPEETPVAAVRVSFNCTPAETFIWVYDAADEDTELEPEEDGSFLLVPGDYVYVAFCEGYEGLYEELVVDTKETYLEIEVLLQKNTILEEAPIVAPSNANSISAWSKTKEYSSLLLDINWSNIQAVGHQISGSNSCSCYAMAYLFTILDGYTHYYSEYNQGTNEYNAWCPWQGNNYTAYFPSEKSDALEFMYSKLSSGVPVVAYVTGRGSSQHFVTVVGFENVSSSGSLSESNFLIIDPWSSSGAFVAENMGGVGYNLLAADSYHVRYPTTGQSVAFSSTSFFPDKPSFINFKNNYPITSGSQTAITFQWSDVGADQYYLDFATLRDDGIYRNWESTLGYSGTQSTALPFSEGWYYVEITAVNSAGTSAPNRYSFSVGNTAPEVSAAVPVNQIEYDGHVYERYDYHMSWTEAKSYCEALGGYLAVPTSQKEQDAINSLMVGRTNFTYYLGLSDTDQNGVLETVTGEPTSYTNWSAGEPSYSPGEYYVQMLVRDYGGPLTSGLWNDIVDKDDYEGSLYSYANAGFICEYDQKCNHDWDNGKLTTEPTCTEEGVKTFTCKSCGETNTEIVAALSHTYVETGIPGSCTQRPGTKYVCSRCGDRYTVWDEGGWSEWSTEYPAGYDENDIEAKVQYRYKDKETTTSSSSSLEGWTLLSSEKVWGEYGPWSDWSRTYVAASDSTQVETAPLYRYYYFLCHGCGDHNPLSSACGCGSASNSWNQRDSTVPYNQSNSSVVSYATSKRQTTSLGDGQLWYFSSGNLNSTAVGTVDADSDGIVINQGYRYRTRTQSTVYNFYRWGEWSEWSDTEVAESDSREVETRTVYRYNLYANGQHSWDAGTITRQPACTTEGVKTFTCGACGETRTEAVPATGHTEVKDAAVAATCTTAGKTEGSHCSVCNAVIKAQTTIPTIAHTEVTDPAVAATCTEEGKTEGSHCSVCGKTLTEQVVVPRAEHTYVNSECTVCGAKNPYACGENLSWSLDENGVLTISGTGEMTHYSNFSDAPWSGEAFNSVIIESGVGSIGDNAFPYLRNCTMTVKSGCSLDLYESICLFENSKIILEGGSSLNLRAQESDRITDDSGITHIQGHFGRLTFHGGNVECRGSGTMTFEDYQNNRISYYPNLYGSLSNATNFQFPAEVMIVYCFDIMTVEELYAALETNYNYAEIALFAGMTVDRNITIPYNYNFIVGMGGGIILTVPAPYTITNNGFLQTVGDGKIRIANDIIVGRTGVILPGANIEYIGCKHEWGNGTVTTEPGCETKGIKTYTCALCRATKTEDIPAAGHTEVEDPAVAATCTTAGKTKGAHCSLCGEVLVAHEVIPATGHSFGEWTETKAPSLTEDGEESRSCRNSGCKETETRPVKAVIYTVSYDANGGTGAPTAQQKLKGTALTLSATKPVLSGYAFKGWALSKTATTVVYTPGASYTADKSVTLYAVWEKDVAVDENTPAIAVSSVKAYPGSTVDVTVSLQNNPGIVGMTLKFAYDSSAMELSSITESGLEGTWIKNKGVTWANSTLTDSTYNGVVLTLTFTVYETAPAGEYEVRVLYEEGDICNLNEEDVNFVSVPGAITVKNRVPGDTNGDDKVNTKDFISLMKQLAGEDVSLVPKSADINGDGKVNTKDFIALMKYLAGDDVTIH